MNSFSLIGKFHNFEIINDNNVKITVASSSPYHKKILIPIITSNEEKIYKLKKGDLLGIKGFIDSCLIASSITWLSQKKK